ncbi:MAG: DUF99 family protein [Desulfurococcaceae archaeon]
MRPSGIEAYDDGYFPRAHKGGKGFTSIAGVLADSPSRAVKLAWSFVRVDANTSEKTIINISNLLGGDVILLDGVTYAGFDVVDPERLYVSTGKAVIAILTHPLNLSRIERALRKHFADWKERFTTIKSVYEKAFYVETPWRTLRVYSVGIAVDNATDLIRKLCIYSPIPEPLRIADKVASAISRSIYKYYE